MRAKILIKSSRNISESALKTACFKGFIDFLQKMLLTSLE